jgi:catecholate siderophore receptor
LRTGRICIAIPSGDFVKDTKTAGARPAILSSAKPALNGAVVAGLAGLMLAPTGALAAGKAEAAETATASAAVTAAGGTEVTGIDVRAGRLNEPESPKYTSRLIDTPQTVTIVSKATIEAQNLMTLRDVLSTVPGITFGAGEGGGGYGDSINLRGYSANSDITVDGVRDSAQYTRSDPFNLEQIEVVNGANSVYSGAGSVGGTINLATKTPGLRDETTISAGAGADDYGRVTVDSNKRVSDSVAIRLNAMGHRNDVPGRDVEQFKRWGIAPSVAFGLNTDTKVTLAWYHQEDDNIPQYGVPYYNGRPVPGVKSSNYYGYRNIDTQQIEVDTLTAILDHRFTDNFRVRNLSRYQAVSQYSAVDPPQGAFCLANGLQPVGWSQTTAATNLTGYQPCTNPGYYQPSGPRGNVRDTRNTLLYNQTDFTVGFSTGPVSHNLVAGAAFSDESFRLDTGNLLRNPGGATPNPVLPPMSIANPDNVYRGPINYVRGSIARGERRNQAVYVFDTIKFGPQFELNGGVRYEHTDGLNRTDAYAATGVVTPGAGFQNDADLFSFRVGGVYKPQPNMSLYVAYGNSKTPSQTQVNGACSAATCNVDPEEAVSYEAGFKWDVYGGMLSLTAAVFRNERTNYKVASGDPTLPDQVLDGSSRVDGVALGASGRITDKWSVFANYTYLKSKVLQGASRFTAGGGVTGTEADFTKGDPIANVPDHAFSLWTTYDLPANFQVGYGVTYSGKSYLSQHGGISVGGSNPARFAGRTTIPLVQTQDYWVHRLMVTYRVNRQLDLRLNVNNLFDKTYYIRGRNNGWATPGEGRVATLTANYRF